tara:strand:+ start:465 stop:1385 length:921 start_codon:yes stop_codon:yes gene_type:complete
MKKILKNHSEVAHFWANKIQSEGKSSNMFFKDNIIYSYGYHFPIAKHVNKDVILFTSKSYSVSTSQHKSHTRNAIPHNKTVFTVPNIDGGKYSSLDLSISDHQKNIEYYIKEIKYNLKKSNRARKFKEMRLNRVLSLITEMKKYLQIFKIKSKLTNSLKASVNMALNMDFDKINDIIKAEQEKNKKAKQLRKAEQKKKFFKKLKEWRNYNIDNLPYYEKQYLRLKRNGWNNGEWCGDVQTSLNVKIPIETFKKYYDMLKCGKSLIGKKISHYTVNKQDDKLLTIGCHKIEIKEIESIANQIKGLKC